MEIWNSTKDKIYSLKEGTSTPDPNKFYSYFKNAEENLLHINSGRPQ
jgi:hypothetical protein